MLNRLASLAMSTSVLKALPGKLDIKRHSPSILYTYWHNLSAAGESGDTQYEFLETCRDCFWWHHMLEPTHGRGRDTPPLLDLVFSNEEGMISDICINAPLCKSDHATTFTSNGYTERSGCKTRYKFEKADYCVMKEQLDMNWLEVLNNITVEEQ